MKRYILLLFVALFFVGQFAIVPKAEAQSTSAQQQIQQIMLTYQSYINQLMLMYPNNPQFAYQLQQAVNQIAAIQAQIIETEAALTTTDYGSGSGSGWGTGSVFLPVYFDFGRGTSTITDITVYPTNNAAAIVHWETNHNEDVYTRISCIDHPEEGCNGHYFAGYTYYKDGELLDSDSENNLYYWQLVDYMGLALDGMPNVSAMAPFMVEFLIRNGTYTQYRGYTGLTEGLDCYADDDKEAFISVLEYLAEDEDYNYVPPVSSITRFVSPLISVDEGSTGCFTDEIL